MSFFAYPNKPSWCTREDCKILYLTHPNEDGTVGLEALADAVKAPKQPLHVGVARKPEILNGPLNPLTAGQVIAHYLPNGAIISDEGATAGAAFIDLRPISSRMIILRWLAARSDKAFQ